MKTSDFVTVLTTVRHEANRRVAAGTATPKTKSLAQMPSPEFRAEAHVNYVRNIWGKRTADEKAKLEADVTVSPPVAKKAKKAKKKKPAKLPVEDDSDDSDDSDDADEDDEAAS